MDHGLSPGERTLIETVLSLNVGLDVQRICTAVLDALTQLFDARSSWIMLIDAATDELVTESVRGSAAAAYTGARIPQRAATLTRQAFARGEPLFIPDVAAETRWYDPARVQQSGLQTVLLVPLLHQQDPVGVLGLDSPRFNPESHPSPADVARIKAVAAQAAIAVRNARLVESIEQDRRRLRRLLQERRHLRDEVGHLRDAVRDARAFSAVVGESRVWGEVLDQVAMVASAESTVLLIGETGTGKELIAHAIHEQSRRRRQSFVPINCAAFPESLVESELFGHERGAFTGAFERKPGKFEIADKGTLFLDEVGELPAAVQAKLLRVLQEREVYRVGGTRPVAVNVRLIAATNRALRALQDGGFRQDLFYRLSVFPITLPPLRARPDDIGLLARHFVRRVAERQGREVPVLTASALRDLEQYSWPGNVRELQNVLERAVILARDGEIGPEQLHLDPARPVSPDRAPAVRPLAVERSPANVIPFSEAERYAIIRALETTGWRISGNGGAADLLGLKPTTLHAKMKRLGVHRPSAHASR